MSRRRRPRGSGPVFTLLLFAVIAFVTWWQDRPQRMEGRVVRVQDGDSFVVMRQGEETVVRLYAIDAPERDQPFGPEARRFVEDAVKGQVVILDVRDTDRYGRLISDVRLTEDGRKLNQELVREGLAWWYRRHSPEDRTLRTLEEEARDARRGLWQDPNPVPPWEFRRD